MGRRISDMRLAGRPLDAGKTYKVAGWAPVAEEARQTGGPPVWDVMAQWLRSNKEVSARPLNLPTVRGMDGNPGMMG
jgi:sulfur-oxidizing protein SoxB